MRVLCRLHDIADGSSRGFEDVFALRLGEQARVYVNACPHLGVGLDWAPDQFMSHDRQHIVCSVHGALFGMEDGLCVRGPCHGDALEAVPCRIEDGLLILD